jgi:FkbM family methyltransferase
MPTEFQKVISVTLILTGAIACVWHLGLTTLATDTASLNRMADEKHNKRAISDVYVVHRADEKTVETSVLAIEAEFKSMEGTMISNYTTIEPTPTPPITKRQCTNDEIDAVVSQEPIANSKCPDQRKWMEEWIQATKLDSNATLISIGCSRGYDLISSMRKWARNASYSLGQLPHACPIVSDDNEPIGPRPVSGFCVEEMIDTFNEVDQMVNQQNWGSELHVIHAIVSSESGISHPPAAVNESLDTGNMTERMDAVRTMTVDELVQENGITEINILSIHTKGNDFGVIEGAINTLPIVSMIEFEYSHVNAWAMSDLDLYDVVSLLNISGFDCFWQGDQGQLWWLTGCWHDSYDSIHAWGNVACAQRNEHTLHSAMVKIAYPTLW